MSNLFDQTLIWPDWPVPDHIKSLQTTRNSGVSQAPYDSLNLAQHVGDSAQHVARNRQLLSQVVPTEPVWLAQVHGTRVIDAAASTCLEQADASFTTRKHVVCAVMTADCLPVLLCDQAGTVIASVHAGWRGLCDGVLEQSVKSMSVPANTIMAWLGPAIGPDVFEVGNEVRDAFLQWDSDAATAFTSYGNKWLADLHLLARQRLAALGIKAIYGEEQCTFSNSDRFFSYRRDGNSGRMASMIWISA